MNAFRFAGDMSHLFSILLLLFKIHTYKSCAGISLKTQELYAIVFTTRYLDIVTDYISLYNTIMKFFFLSSSFSIVWYMRYHKAVQQYYDKDQDTFWHYILILPCLVLALFVHNIFTFREVLWTFSLYLEAVAILPQLLLLQRTKNVDILTENYVFFLGAYRGFYILNWIYRYFTESYYQRWITWISGLVQTALYANFFYYYLKRRFCGKEDTMASPCGEEDTMASPGFQNMINSFVPTVPPTLIATEQGLELGADQAIPIECNGQIVRDQVDNNKKAENSDPKDNTLSKKLEKKRKTVSRGSSIYSPHSSSSSTSGSVNSQSRMIKKHDKRSHWKLKTFKAGDKDIKFDSYNGKQV